MSQTSKPDDLTKDAHRLYQSYRNAATRQTKVENLDRLWMVLEAIRSEGKRDYSISEIGRRLEAVGGPKTQSLRNAQGAHFREVATAYAAGVNGDARKVAAGSSSIDQALSFVSDPSVRATLRMAIEEGRRLKVVNDNLHNAFKNLSIGAEIGLGCAQPAIGGHVEILPPVTSSLSPRLKAALVKGVDETRLAQQGLVIAEDGSIRTEAGDRVFPPGFVDAIRSAIEGKG